MNALTNAVAFTSDAAEPNPAIDEDAPIGLPGEQAPEVKIDQDEEREPAPRARGGLRTLLVRLRASRKAPKAETESGEAPLADLVHAFSAETGRVEGTKADGEERLMQTIAQAANVAGVGQTEEGAPGADKAKAKRKGDIRLLLGGVAAVAIVVAAAGYFLMPSKALKRVVTEPGMLTQAPPLLAPAASLASVPKPEAVPLPEAPQKKGAIGDPLQEILALKPEDRPLPVKSAAAKVEKPTETGSPPPVAKPLSGAEGEQKATSPQDGPPPAKSAAAKVEKPAETASPPPAAKPLSGAEAGKKATSPQDRAQNPPAGSAKPGEGTVAAQGPSMAAATPVVEAAREPDAAEPGLVKAKAEGQGGGARQEAQPEANEERPSPEARVAEARADTATLDRVTQLAALVAHLSDEVNGLASQEEKLVSETEERLADLQRRVALAELTRELKTAEKAQGSRYEVEAPATSGENRSPLTGRMVIKTGPAATEATDAAERHAYRIQAASPSLAMLGTGDNAPPLEVAPGTTIPGWGRVSKIEQRGQSWVVVTDQGVIQ